MRFALCQVLRRLMSRKGRGILEMFQMILSFFLMTCCLNLFLSTSALRAREDISDHTVSRIQWTQRTSGGLLQNGYAGVISPRSGSESRGAKIRKISLNASVRADG